LLHWLKHVGGQRVAGGLLSDPGSEDVTKYRGWLHSRGWLGFQAC